jgi:hypothetical protein
MCSSNDFECFASTGLRSPAKRHHCKPLFPADFGLIDGIKAYPGRAPGRPARLSASNKARHLQDAALCLSYIDLGSHELAIWRMVRPGLEK